MITSQIEESLVTHSIYDEYLNKVVKYQNCLRTSIFIRYLNINKTASSHHDITDATFDKFNSGIYFDVYDYTPAYLVNQITNTSADRNDLVGYKFDGELSIVTYSITEPNINDIVLFPYKPHNSENIFRVKNITTTIKNKIYQLDLEYAPISNLTSLNYLNNFVYLVTKEKNILSSKFIQLVTLYDNIKNDLSILQLKFNYKHELYYFDFNGNQIAPLNINNKINSYMSFEFENNRYMDNFIKPYGIIGMQIPEENIGINISNKNTIVYLNDLNLPKLLTNLDFAIDPLVFDINIDYSQFSIDMTLFNLSDKLQELYEI